MDETLVERKSYRTSCINDINWKMLANFPMKSTQGCSQDPPMHFCIFEAHRTPLVERTVLLYVPTKPIFFVKNPTQSTIGGPWPPGFPSGYAPESTERSRVSHVSTVCWAYATRVREISHMTRRIRRKCFLTVGDRDALLSLSGCTAYICLSCSCLWLYYSLVSCKSNTCKYINII